MVHTDFRFCAGKKDGDIIATCQEAGCGFKVLYHFQSGNVDVLDHGDISIGHSVSYVPTDLKLSITVGGSTQGSDIAPQSSSRPCETCHRQ